MNRDLAREAFERWYNAEYVRPIIPADRTEGGYQHPDAQAAWDAWQAALSHAEGEAPAEATEALAFVARAGGAISSLYLTKFEECINTIRASISRPEGKAVGVVEPADHQTPEAWLGDKPRRMAVAETSPGSIQTLPEGTKIYTHPAPQVAVPEGYALVPVEPTEAMLHAPLRFVERPHHTAVADSRRRWAEMLAAAPTAPAGEAEFHVEHKTLRSAMAYVGIAAPESDEELGAEMERHTKRVIRAAAQLLSQQPVSDPDGLPSDWRRVVEGAADMLGESAKQHRGRGDNATAAMCDRFGAMLRDEILSAPAPDEREIAALLERIVPRIDPKNPKPLDEIEHCCECTLYYERERIHGEIARLRAGKEGEDHE